MPNGTIVGAGAGNGTAGAPSIIIGSGDQTFYFYGTSLRDVFVEDGVMYGYSASGNSLIFGKFELAPGETLSTNPKDAAQLVFTEIQADSNGDGVGDDRIINGSGSGRQGSDVYNEANNTALILDRAGNSGGAVPNIKVLDLDDNSFTLVKNLDGTDFAFSSTTTGGGYEVTAFDVATDPADGQKYLFYTTTVEVQGYGAIWRAKLGEDANGNVVISDFLRLEQNSADAGIGEAHNIDVVEDPDAAGGYSIIINGAYSTADRINIFTQTGANSLGKVSTGDYTVIGTPYPGISNPNGTFGTWNGELPSFVCFAAGTKIMTPDGEIAIEKIIENNLISTLDNGAQPVRWIGKRKLTWLDLAYNSHLLPVRIKAGALGNNAPTSDLLVSPQHRVLVRSKVAQRMFGVDEVLVAAKHLLEMDGVEIATDITKIEYYHILFDRHEVIFSNGTETESLYTGSQTLKSLAPEALDEVFTLFPELRNQEVTATPPTARPFVSGRLGKKLVARHSKNNLELHS